MVKRSETSNFMLVCTEYLLGKLSEPTSMPTSRSPGPASSQQPAASPPTPAHHCDHQILPSGHRTLGTRPTTMRTSPSNVKRIWRAWDGKQPRQSQAVVVVGLFPDLFFFWFAIPVCHAAPVSSSYRSEPACCAPPAGNCNCVDAKIGSCGQAKKAGR